MEASQLASGDVHVWHAAVDLGDPAIARAWRDLPDADRARADRYAIDRARREFVATRSRLRRILAGYVAASPTTLAIAADPRGKPRLVGDAPVQFNLSHSGARLVVAVARTAVGVDIEEMVRPLAAMMAMARRYFADGEIRGLEEAPANVRRAAAYQCWTRKEALLKAAGVGLAASLRSFAVTVPPRPPAIIAADSPAFDPARWTMVDLRPPGRYAGALASDGPIGRLVERTWPVESDVSVVQA